MREVGSGWSVSGGGVGNIVCACCSASLMVLGICLYLTLNSSGVSMPIVSGFWICTRVVMPYMYSFSRCFWVIVLDDSGRLV